MNTSINDSLEVGRFYLIMGKIITSADGKPPTITYNQGSAAPVATSEGASLDMMNRVGIVGLGKVFSSTEVITESGEGPTALEVVVNHNDWDPRVSEQFTLLA
jgi:hypothetical protein